MFKFLLQLLKNKKILVFSFLVLVIFLIGFLGIEVDEADAYNPETEACEQKCRADYANTDPTDPTMDNCILGCVQNYGGQTDNFGKILGEELSREYGELAEQLAIPFAAFVFGVGAVIISIGGSLSVLASSMLVSVLGMIDKVGCYTCMQNTAIANGWPRVRDLANIVVVLGFVVIGISTTLRFRDYEAKKLLPKLIIAAILINFSLLICGVFIDGSNIASKYFLQSGGFFAHSWEQTLESQIKVLTNEWSSSSGYIKASINLLGAIGGITFYNIFAIIIFLLYAFLYIFRIIALWILVILSPLAFVFSVFPFTQKFFSMWWNNFLAWCIIIIPISFFVWLADKIMEGITRANTDPPGFFAYLIPGCLMLLGFILSTQMSAMGASAAVGAAKWTKGKAMGAVAGGGGGLLKASGLSGLAQRAGTAAKDSATSVGERLNLVSKGTTASNKAGRLAESKKRLGNIQDNKELAKIAEQRPMSQKQRNDQAAAAEILAERKAFGTIDPNKRDTIAARAVASGVKKDVFTKVRPETFAGASNVEATEKATHNEAQRYMNSTGASMDTALKTLKSTGWKPGVTEIRDAKKELAQRKVTENALGLAPINNKDATNKWLEDQQKAFMGMGDTREEAVAKTQKLKPNVGQIAEGKENLAQERIQKEFAKLDVGKIRTLPNEALSNIEFIKNVGTQRLSRAALEMSQDKINKMKEVLPEMKNIVTSDLGLPSTATAAQIKTSLASARPDVQKKVREMTDKINTLNKL